MPGILSNLFSPSRNNPGLHETTNSNTSVRGPSQASKSLYIDPFLIISGDELSPPHSVQTDFDESAPKLPPRLPPSVISDNHVGPLMVPKNYLPVLPLLLQPRPTDVFIAVMGVTGVGKSTLISLCTNREVEIGHGLSSCTRDVAVYAYDYNLSTTVYMVDTPGFDDETRPDSEVLRELAGWLTASYASNIKLNGIIYLHRITDDRLGGQAKSNLIMFKQLCGPDAFSNVILATTMWESVEPTIGAQRELELKNKQDYWGFMISKGSRVVRHMNTVESARQLVEIYASQTSNIAPKALEIQVDMVERGLGLEQTRAGKEVEGLIAAEKARMETELQEMRDSMAEALQKKDKASAEAIKKNQKDANDKMDRLKQQSEDLKINMERLHREKYAKLESSLEMAKKANQKVQEDLGRAEQERDRMNAEVQKTKKQAGEDEKRHRETLKTLEKRIEERAAEAKSEAERAKEKEREFEWGLEHRTKEMAIEGKIAAQKAELTEEESEERMNKMAINAGLPPPYKPRPGPKNRISEYVSLGICGSYYYFCGPARDCFRMPPDWVGEGSTKFIALGMKNSWYRIFAGSDGVIHREISGDFSTNYKGLYDYIKEHELFEIPQCMALGDDGNFFAKFSTASYYCLPQNIIDHIEHSNMTKVQYMALGKNAIYVAVVEGKGTLWNLGSNYNGLADDILKKDATIKALALNSEDTSSHIAVWDDGAGMASTFGGNFNLYWFKDFTAKNFGTDWTWP